MSRWGRGDDQIEKTTTKGRSKLFGSRSTPLCAHRWRWLLFFFFFSFGFVCCQGSEAHCCYRFVSHNAPRAGSPSPTCVCQKRSQAVPYLRCWARAHLSLYRLLHGVPYKTIYRCQAPSVRFFLFLFLLFHFSTSTVSTLDVSRTKRRRLLFIDKATTFDILVSEKRVGVCRQSRQKRMSA